jgi:superfamily II DNA or RNA helicase
MQTLRYYQQEANAAIDAELLNADKCIVKMFCGTGKSIIMRKCNIVVEKSLVVYVFPSLSLIDQFYTDYLHDVQNDRILQISSENDATTNPDIITQFLSSSTPCKIICVTYQSFKTLIDNLNGRKIGVCIFDEAHHAVGETYQQLIFENEVCEKQIFFTATPKNANGVIMYDRNNPDGCMCGKLAYEYSYLRGMNEGYLNPIEIRVDMFMENTNKSIYESIARAILASGNNRVLTFHSDVNTDRAHSVLNFVNNTAFRAAFKDVQRNEFPTIKKYKKVNIVALTSADRGKQRRKILDEFDAVGDTEVIVISSCETIGEGIDTKNANMCVFVDPKTSYVKIIQNMGRIVRKTFEIEKSCSTILIPCWVDKTKYLACDGDREKCDEVIRQDMSKDGNFNGILNVLGALKQEDDELYDICIYHPTTFTPKEIEDNLAKQGYIIADQVGEGGLLETVEYLLEVELDYSMYDECETDEDMLMQIANEYGVRIDIHTDSLENPVETYNGEGCYSSKYIIRLYKGGNNEGCMPITKCGDNTDNIQLKRTKDEIECLQRKFKTGLRVHTNPDVKVLWKILSDIDIFQKICSCVIDCELVDKWVESFKALKTFIDENKRMPSSCSKHIAEKSLGYWLINQKKNYKNKINAMKNEIKYNLWTNFIEEYKEYSNSADDIWYASFAQLKTFINENNRIPTTISKHIVEKKLSSWVGWQKINYKNKKQAMNDETKYNLWTTFMIDYKEYVKGVDDFWYKSFADLKTFIDENKKPPSQTSKNTNEKQLGSWLNNQKNNYNNKIRAMNDITKYNLWTSFINEYYEYLKNFDDFWYKSFADLKTFIDYNKKLPCKRSSDTNEKQLGSWLTNQKNNYKNKDRAMNDKIKYNLWEKFIKEYKEYLKNLDDIWYELFAQLKEFIDKNNILPNKRSNDVDEKKLGNWLSNQKNNYADKECSMKDNIKYNIWTAFIEEYKEYFKDFDNIWYETFEKLKEFIEEYKRLPSQHSINANEKKVGQWLSTQKQNYKNKEQSMKDKTKYKLWTDCIQQYKEYFKDFDTIWYETFEKLKEFINKYKKMPSQHSKNTDEKKLGQWISNQKKNYKNKKESMKDETKYNLWTDFIATLENKEEEPESTNTQLLRKKSMKLAQSPSTKLETPQQACVRIKSTISQLHQRYKTLTSSNLHQEFNNNVALWHTYHEISEQNEKTFPDDDIPRNRIIAELDKVKSKRTKVVVDMGCGKAQISAHFHNDSRFRFINYDHIAIHDAVISCDISNIPLDNDAVDICILSLAMWGSNCKDYIKEAYRILESGGMLYIIESTKRWSHLDDGGNIAPGQECARMKALLEENTFKIIDQQIAKFGLFICVKL